ncbi:hypothetical protein Sste5346_009871 [Sporothrix stenoceras]|uniref:SMP-30/Gluconolactonase/LRE-like region domain-containing protein n=1 Tax=Sporothrix stenoceras TaxID=5173 RepID=A0ABR3YKN3_9PEZI
MTSSTPTYIPQQTLADGFFFGEAPRYHHGRLYFSDMIGRKIYTIDAVSGEKKVLLEVDQQPNGMCFTDDGSLIYSSMFDAKLYRYKDGKSTLYSDMSGTMTGYCGDMVIDNKGRVFLDDTGARVLHGQKPGPGRLLRIDPDGSVVSVQEGAVFPNLLCISPDGKTLYNAETFGYGLYKFDLADNGTLSNKQKVWAAAKPPGEGGGSLNGIDGGCMDGEGGVWLSLLGMEQFARLDPATGNITHRVKVDGHATACTLGGEDGKTLFMVTNSVPDGENIFTAMVARKTRCTVSTARVDIAHGTARP